MKCSINLVNLGDRSTVLVDQIQGEASGVRSVWLKNLDLDLFYMNLELVKLYQTSSKTHSPKTMKLDLTKFQSYYRTEKKTVTFAFARHVSL